MAVLADTSASDAFLLVRFREKHPDVVTRDIVRAAFYALTDPDTDSAERVKRLHGFALDLKRGVEPRNRVP